MYKRNVARWAMVLTAVFLIMKWLDDRGRMMRFFPMRRSGWLARMQMNTDFGRTIFRVMGNRLMRRMVRAR